MTRTSESDISLLSLPFPGPTFSAGAGSVIVTSEHVHTGGQRSLHPILHLQKKGKSARIFSLGLLDLKSYVAIRSLAGLRQFLSNLVVSLSSALLLAKVTPIFGLSGLTIPHSKKVQQHVQRKGNI